MRVFLVAIQHFNGWPQVLSCHATRAAAHAAASRDGYTNGPEDDPEGCCQYLGSFDYHPVRLVIAMDVQP